MSKYCQFVCWFASVVFVSTHFCTKRTRTYKRCGAVPWRRKNFFVIWIMLFLCFKIGFASFWVSATAFVLSFRSIFFPLYTRSVKITQILTIASGHVWIFPFISPLLYYMRNIVSFSSSRQWWQWWKLMNSEKHTNHRNTQSVPYGVNRSPIGLVYCDMSSLSPIFLRRNCIENPWFFFSSEFIRPNSFVQLAFPLQSAYTTTLSFRTRWRFFSRFTYVTCIWLDWKMARYMSAKFCFLHF